MKRRALLPRLSARWTLILALMAAVAMPAQQVRFVGKTKYLNNAKAVVVHSIDDSTKFVPETIDVMDRYGIKSTIFVSTDPDPAPEDRFFTQLQIRGLWPRLREAIAAGHEIGSHSRQHPCQKPDDEKFCSAAYSDYEITGSRDDILRLTQQPHVWTWCYPCGNCATYPFIQQRIAAAGYLVARNYPNELTNGHIRPDVQDFDSNAMNAGYTQVVQHRGMAKTDPIDLPALNAKFDEVYAKGGVYHFMSHPQWLDFGADAFYEAHVRYVSRHRDVWYVPMGPLYAFRTIRDRTAVTQSGNSFTVSNGLDRRIYNGTLTLEFDAPAGTSVLSNGKLLSEQGEAMTDRWDREYIRRDGAKLYATVLSNTKLQFLPATTPADLSGTWKLSYRAPNGKERAAQLVLQQSGTQLSGTLSSERGKAPITEGRVNGNQVALTIVRKGHGVEVPIALAGIWADGRLHLTLQFGGAEPVGATASR
ncbi:MAG: polysaccharide deacetylase family protein [Bryobacteraceae bacterium]